MHELASMAATKAQEMTLPPPPVDFISSPASEKPSNEGEKDGSTSESSLESSSGYGSQTTFTAEDPAHTEGIQFNSFYNGRMFLMEFYSQISQLLT